MDDKKAFKILSTITIVISMTIVIFNAWVAPSIVPSYKDYKQIFNLKYDKTLNDNFDEESNDIYENESENDLYDDNDAEEIVVVNINEADIDELMMIPYVGETLANRILEYRETYGPFESVDELLDIVGIGEKKLQKMIDYISLE